MKKKNFFSATKVLQKKIILSCQKMNQYVSGRKVGVSD